MDMRIKQLPPLIANQIAAGEVIERPASVVKELLENSLDAGADVIVIEVSYGGLNQIKISDNGCGIVAADLPLAVAAHATSKINTLDDLYAIDSMGFRGEALASIASVAKVTLSSKPDEQDIAMMVHVQPGKQITLSPCARTRGTTVDVIDLFFNAPVRKRFLKSEKLEFQAIETLVKRFALSAPAIALTLKHNGKEILSLPAVTSEPARLTRMTRILGHAFIKDAIYLDVEHDTMKLYGWISGVHFQRSQNDRLWIYINQRMVKDKLIYHALKRAYEGLLHPGRFPACVLYLTMKHAEIDVNVHPTKHEVRFTQPRLIFDFFTSQLTAALKSRFTEETPYASFAVCDSEKAQDIYEPCPKFIVAERKNSSNNALEEVRWIILNNRYILTFLREQPYIVDVVALQYYKIEQQLAHMDYPLTKRPLLVPVRHSFLQKLNWDTVTLSQSLSQLGMDLHWLESNEVLIRSIPVCMPYLDLHAFLDAVAGLDALHQNTLLELMNQSHVFDPRLIPLDEKMKLNELLLGMCEKEENKSAVFKRLTIEDCRSLVH